MKGVVKDNARTTGYLQYPPTNVPSTASKVHVEGILVVRDGDSAEPHQRQTDPRDISVGTVVASTGKVFAEGKKIARMADMTAEGDTIAEASSKVFAG